MSDPVPNWRLATGQRFERFSHDVFDTFRWMMTVGVSRYIAIKTDSSLFLLVSYGLSAVLLIFLMSIFMLRGDMTLFRGPSPWVGRANIAANLVICATAFAACLWLTFSLVNDFVQFQGG